MASLLLTITDAGRAALLNAAHDGTGPTRIAQVGVSSTAVVPSKTAAALPGELKRLATFSGDIVAADMIHIVVRDETADAYPMRAFALYLQDGTLFGIYGQADVILDKTSTAIGLLAVDVTLADIDAAQLTFGDTNFLNPPATTERQGVVELATNAETIGGTDAVRAVVPAALKATLDDRFGAGAPSAYVKSLLTSASAMALRAGLGLGNVAVMNAGAGNGLDADKLDGLEGAAYALRNQNVQFGDILASRGNGQGLIALGDSGHYLHFDGTNYYLTGAPLFLFNGLAWSAGNDGAGSGMDSDLLDGQQGTWYADIAARLGYSPANRNGDTFGGVVAINFNGATLRLDTPGLADSSLEFVRNGVRRWNWGDSPGAEILYVNRYNAAGAFLDTPFALRATDGTATFRKTPDVFGANMWHAANDGAGSGMDTDLFHGHTIDEFPLRGEFGYGENANGFWERRPNGMLECAGVVNYTSADEPVITVQLPAPYLDANYRVSIVPMIKNPNPGANTWVQLIESTKTTTSFQVQYQHTGFTSDSYLLDGFEFRALGR